MPRDQDCPSFDADEDGDPINEATPLLTNDFMTLEEAIANPDAFVSGMSEDQSFCVFVPQPINRTVADLNQQELPGSFICTKYIHCGKHGTLVTCKDAATLAAVKKLFDV